MKVFVRIILAVLAVLALPTVMTGTICHWGFISAWNLDGQCGASDPPSEVFLSFLMMSAILAVFVLLIWFLTQLLIWFLTKFLSSESTS